MSAPVEKLPRGTLAALERAVEEAAAWRGYYTHDQEALEAYDAELTKMRAAVKAVKEQQRALNYMLKLVAEGKPEYDQLH
jgi:hypothetical protein